MKTTQLGGEKKKETRRHIKSYPDKYPPSSNQPLGQLYRWSLLDVALINDRQESPAAIGPERL